MAELIRIHAGKDIWKATLDKAAPILPIFEAMFDTEPEDLTAFCEATREAMEHVERERSWEYFANAEKLASLILVKYVRRNRDDEGREKPTDA